MGEVLEETLTPLMRSEYPFTAYGFYPIGASMEGRTNTNGGWNRPPGTTLMV